MNIMTEVGKETHVFWMQGGRVRLNEYNDGGRKRDSCMLDTRGERELE